MEKREGRRIGGLSLERMGKAQGRRSVPHRVCPES